MHDNRALTELAAAEQAQASGATAAAFAALARSLAALRTQGSLTWAAELETGAEATAFARRFVAVLAAANADPRWSPLDDNTALSAFLFELVELYTLVRVLPEGHLDTLLAAQSAALQKSASAANFVKLLLLWTPSSRAMAFPADLLDSARLVVVAQALATIALIVCCDERADAARNAAIRLLTGDRVRTADLYAFVDRFVFAGAWMRCSYATAADRHVIKPALNRAIVQRLASLPAVAPRRAIDVPSGDKPLLVAPLEWAFQEGGAMYRCYAAILRDLRTRFRTVGLGTRRACDARTEALFDRFHYLEDLVDPARPEVPQLRAAIEAARPDLVFYPSVGMLPSVMFLANARLAPVQVMSVGHPATSGSAAIDWAMTERGFVGGAGIFTERFLPVPDGSMSFHLPEAATGRAPAVRDEPADGVVHVAVPAVGQKLSWRFVETLRAARAQAGRPVVLHFFTGLQGTNFRALASALRQAIPDAKVYPLVPYAEYIARLAHCRLHAASFPFGGTNSVIDSLRHGVPVVALEGREVHERVDGQMLRRIGLAELVTDSEAEFTALLARLIADPAHTAALATRVRDAALASPLLTGDGDPRAWTEALAGLLPREGGPAGATMRRDA